MPNHILMQKNPGECPTKRDMANRPCIPQIPSCNVPSGKKTCCTWFSCLDSKPGHKVLDHVRLWSFARVIHLIIQYMYRYICTSRFVRKKKYQVEFFRILLNFGKSRQISIEEISHEFVRDFELSRNLDLVYWNKAGPHLYKRLKAGREKEA